MPHLSTTSQIVWQNGVNAASKVHWSWEAATEEEFQEASQLPEIRSDLPAKRRVIPLNPLEGSAEELVIRNPRLEKPSKKRKKSGAAGASGPTTFAELFAEGGSSGSSEGGSSGRRENRRSANTASTGRKKVEEFVGGPFKDDSSPTFKDDSGPIIRENCAPADVWGMGTTVMEVETSLLCQVR